ncbi:hypothetical protein CRG98_046498 [Punica granatum]|uniref:Uncharacterized protein n=1 Tax=Punica granatum TaxID=22663 RepID=A0A2I0HN66_PUNGR|nr:hypothetical protein CRG98_046498 [Punica granatum]
MPRSSWSASDAVLDRVLSLSWRVPLGGSVFLKSASVPIAEGGLGPFFDQERDRARSPVADGLGHAMFVGAVACDLSWREDRSSVIGVQGVGMSELPLRLWLADHFLIIFSSLSAKVCRSWFVETRWDPRGLTDFIEARTRDRARRLLPRRKED